MKQKIGLIGVGNMGTAILSGLLKKSLVQPKQIWVYDKIVDKAGEFSKRHRLNLASSNTELAKNVEVVILAVKPQDLTETLKEMSGLQNSHILISILAGTPIAKIKSQFGAFNIVRAMPNLAAKVGEGVTALTGSDAKAVDLAEQIFSCCGKTVRLEEKFFDLVTAISGSGPAYFFLFMELLMKEGVESGLKPEQARLLAVQTALGAGKLAALASEMPDELRKQVTSKGGTTEAALKVLENKKFPEIFHDALQAALNRGRELSQ